MFKNLKSDFPASLVVFLVALPLCLGIALASGAPPFAGIIAGIVGGIAVGYLSGSPLSVSGPAAGLTVIVLDALDQLKGFGENPFGMFLVAVVMAGVIQVGLGFLKLGTIGNYFPSSVIKGMLAAIGLILILKQIPHAVGFDADYEGDEAFDQNDGNNTFTELFQAILNPSSGPLIISLICCAVLIFWDSRWMKKLSFTQIVPGALAVVVLGITIDMIYQKFFPGLKMEASQLVSLPTRKEIPDNIKFPDWTILSKGVIYFIAIKIAIIASLESLLSLEASDKIDPLRRVSPPNRELKAQGVGNILSGLIGGLPVTAVIVRSSANANAGAKSKLSTITHGLLLLISAILIPDYLNLIPKSALAALLILVGYKLVKPAIIKEMFRKGYDQFIPFVVTIVAILLTDLLVGIAIGMLVGVGFVIKSNFINSVKYSVEGKVHSFILGDNVSYLNKGYMIRKLMEVPKGSTIKIDGTASYFIDADIQELIENLLHTAKDRGLDVEIEKSTESRNEFFSFTGQDFKNE